ncbi:DUF5690 family protein [Bacteroides sp.]
MSLMLRDRLSKSPLWVLALYASILIFLVYTCAYAFRKPFTVAIYEGETLWGFDAKILYVLSEIIGYALSKFIGVRILPSMKPEYRIYYIIGLLSVSELALLGFATLPVSLKVFSIFLSGLPLGMIWGVIFSYIEGRRISEVLNVGLSVALIVSSGLVKTLGQFVMNNFHVEQYWMPFVTGLLVFPLMLLCSWLLNQIPAPNEQDVVQRTKRAPMNKKERQSFLRQFFWGICMLILFYGALTVFRELRDSFAADIWKELHVEGAMIFTQTELPIALFVLVLMFMIVFIRNNQLALNIIYCIAVIGSCLMIFSTLLYINGFLSPIWWMILSGLGLYMGYIPFTYLIERLIASLKVVSTAVFIIYLADSFGYLGTTGVFMIKNFVSTNVSWTNMLMYTAILSGGISMLSVWAVYIYFKKQLNSLILIPENIHD